MSCENGESHAWQCRDVVVSNGFGIHARPAALIAKTASRFAAEISLCAPECLVVDGKAIPGEQWTSVSAKSPMGLLSLTAACGMTLRIEARGPDAAAALDALEALFRSGFGEQ